MHRQWLACRCAQRYSKDMSAHDTSAGDPLAEKRADYAEMLFAEGDHAAAADLMLEALERVPAWALGWFRLGEFQSAAERPALAEKAWRMAHTLDPDDRAGAALKLQLAGAMPGASAPPSAFVETLFDQYADRFDHALVDTLHYRVPQLLIAAIEKLGERRFAHALDLGCGTGLMGARLRATVDRLDGQDISSAMLAKAKARSVYDRLTKSDLQTLTLPPHSLDLVTAADVFLYVGGLDKIFAEVAGALRPGGLFGFSVEKHFGTEDFILCPTRRYAHARRYLERLVSENGLTLLSLEEAAIRRDRNADVPGLVVIAAKLETAA